MNLYRIYTEKTENMPKVKAEIDKQFQGYTLLEGQGVWKAVPESSLVIEIVSESPELPKVKRLAETIRLVNHQ